MSDFERLSVSKKKVITDYVEKIDESDEVLGTLKIMKRILNVAFGEAYNQITKPSPDSIMDILEAHGYDNNFQWRSDNEVADILKRVSPGFSIIIYFPEVTITNSRKVSHDIKDLYIKLNLKANTKVDTGLQGLRTTVSKDEYFNGYFHSHLRTFDPMSLKFTTFCLGTGEITQVLALLANKFDEANFTLFCIHLKNYVKWESIEGNPHKHMENISTNGLVVPTLHNSTTKKAVELAKPYFFGGLGTMKDNLKFSIGPKGISVESTEDFEIQLRDVLAILPVAEIDRYQRSSEFLFVQKDTTGNYHPLNIGNRTRTIAFQSTSLFKFKGEDKFFKVLNNDNEIKSVKYPNPCITQEFCYQLGRDLTKEAITNKGTEIEAYSLGDQSKVAESDLFPL